MGKIADFCNALNELGDGRYSYWNGQTGIGCSDYVRMALGLAGVITSAEADDSTSLWAAQCYRVVLRDTTRFAELSASTTPQRGDIMWYHGHHVSVSNGSGGVWEAAPHTQNGKVTHPLNDLGGEVGLYSNHSYNCSGGTLTCIYRIIEDSERKTEDKMIKASDLIKVATDVCMGTYGATAYNNTYPYNVGKWDGSQWSFDCLGFVHTMVNGFSGDKTKLGGGAVMDSFVNSCNEASTLASCTTYSKFNGSALKKGELLQTSGHVGLYIGDYEVKRSNGTVDVYNTAECTVSWNGGCLLSWVDISNGNRYNKKGGTYRSTWNYHGQLGRVDYSDQTDTTQAETTVEESTADVTVLTPAEKLQTAIDVINGKWDKNPTRKEKLTAAYGSDVAIQIQNLVNAAYE